jgi:hypoxanthine phosphoribosyltransferase
MEKKKCTWHMFDKGVLSLCAQINRSGKKIDSVYGIPRGGLPLGVALSHALKIPYIIDEKKITKHTLIADDISDHGTTLAKFRKKKYLIATLYATDFTITKPDFFVYRKNKEWIIYPWELESTTCRRDGKRCKRA